MAPLKDGKGYKSEEEERKKGRRLRFITNLRFYSDRIWLPSIRHSILIFIGFEDDI